MSPYQGRVLAAGALLLSPYVAMSFWLASHLGLQGCAAYLLVCLSGLLLLAIPTVTIRRFLWWHFPVFVACTLLSGYAVVCDQLPGQAIALVLETSPWEEVRGFFGLWQGQRLLLLFAAVSFCYLVLALSIPASLRLAGGSAAIRRVAVRCLGLLAVDAAASPERLMEGAAASPVLGAAMFVSGPLSSVDYELHGALKRKHPYGAQRVSAREVHILVIGESSRRDSWSVYGYARPTTPYLQSIAAEVIFLRNAVTDANATIFAVPILLTGTRPEVFEPWATTGNIVDLTKESGYFTAWLVNQDPSASSLVGVDPDASKYTYQPKRMTYFATYSPDQVLLSEFERQIARRDAPLFVGIHVYGSHAPYSNRYPSSFARLSVAGEQRDCVDSYDDSIRYSDWFLGQVIERVRRLDVPATVTYLSDHGEDLQQLDGRSGHGAADYSPHVFEIPAFVWPNLAYRRKHPEKIAALVANASKEVRTHDFFYSLADLMGIRWPGLSSRSSFASADFVPDVTEKHIAGGNLVSAPR